jgi:DNA polymerase elongation subunit (family B)
VQDLSLVKSYVLQQCDKVRSGRVALQDFLIFSEVRGASGEEYAGTAPPHAQVAMARARADRRDAAEAGERIPYVVAHTRNAPINRLIESSRWPPTYCLLTTFYLLLAAHYYLLTTHNLLATTHMPLARSH